MTELLVDLKFKSLKSTSAPLFIEIFLQCADRTTPYIAAERLISEVVLSVISALI